MLIKFHLRGEIETRQVWLNGKELDPKRSQKIINHSPDGFSWGYNGSGPAQLALAVCLELLSEEEAIKIYQHFKQHIIADFDQNADFDEYITLDSEDW